MFNIRDYLKKFSDDIDLVESERRQVAEVIGEKVGVEVAPNIIETKKGILCLNCGSALKNKIFMNKKAILDDIANRISSKITDIR